MYDTKKFLVSILCLGGIIKLLQLGVVVHHTVSSSKFSTTLLVSAILTIIYVTVHLMGLISAAKERKCGLKAFSVIQTIYVVMHIVGLLWFLWGLTSFHHPVADNLETNQPISLTKLNGDEDILTKPEQDGTSSSTTTTSTTTTSMNSPPCKFSKYVAIGMFSAFILVTVLDLLSAILAWKGYKQLVAAEAAVETFTYLSGNDSDIMMTPPVQQPLNVVYVPANLYDPTQLY